VAWAQFSLHQADASDIVALYVRTGEPRGGWSLSLVSHDRVQIIEL
jgi:hypothetical protein